MERFFILVILAVFHIRNFGFYIFYILYISPISNCLLFYILKFQLKFFLFWLRNNLSGLDHASLVRYKLSFLFMIIVSPVISEIVHIIIIVLPIVSEIMHILAVLATRHVLT